MRACSQIRQEKHYSTGWKIALIIIKHAETINHETLKMRKQSAEV